VTLKLCKQLIGLILSAFIKAVYKHNSAVFCYSRPTNLIYTWCLTQTRPRLRQKRKPEKFTIALPVCQPRVTEQ